MDNPIPQQLLKQSEENFKILSEVVLKLGVLDQKLESYNIDSIRTDVSNLRQTIQKHNFTLFGVDNQNGVNSAIKTVVAKLQNIEEEQTRQQIKADQRATYLKYIWGFIAFFGIGNIWQLVHLIFSQK